MKDIEKIIADLQAWVEEDKENIAIALVAVQKTEDRRQRRWLRLSAANRNSGYHGLSR